MKGIRILLASIRKADKEYNLINDNDKIVIGVSGGKDSMALLYSLHLYKKFSKSNFEIYPCMIDLGFDNFNPIEVVDFCKKLRYNLEILSERQVYQILKIQQVEQKLPHIPCSICSRMKKAIINKYAKKIGANKVAFAHHKDDAIETLFLNEIYGGRIATFSPKMLLSNENITFIRPFILVREGDIKKTINEEKIPLFSQACPNDKHTKREEIKKVLGEIYRLFPSSEDNFLTMLTNAEKEDVFYMHEEHKIEGTNIYYKLVRSINDFIEYKIFLNEDVNLKDKNCSHFLIYEDNKLVGASSISKIKDREYSLDKLSCKNKDIEILFLEDIKKELYYRYNPYTLIENDKNN